MGTRLGAQSDSSRVIQSLFGRIRIGRQSDLFWPLRSKFQLGRYSWCALLCMRAQAWYWKRVYTAMSCLDGVGIEYTRRGFGIEYATQHAPLLCIERTRQCCVCMPRRCAHMGMHVFVVCAHGLCARVCL